MTNNNQTSKYFRYEFWKKAKNALLNIVYGFIALIIIALIVYGSIALVITILSIAAIVLPTIALCKATIPEAFSIVIIVALLAMACWIIGSWIRGEI